LVSEGIIHDIDILKVSHHGSKYASGSAFLNEAKPELSVISAGRNNIYGHPSPATLSRLNESGSKVYRVDLEGAVIMEFY
jgi:competence protein ComEC